MQLFFNPNHHVFTDGKGVQVLAYPDKGEVVVNQGCTLKKYQVDPTIPVDQKASIAYDRFTTEEEAMAMMIS